MFINIGRRLFVDGGVPAWWGFYHFFLIKGQARHHQHLLQKRAGEERPKKTLPEKGFIKPVIPWKQPSSFDNQMGKGQFVFVEYPWPGK
jgi:hypothetical protein